MFKIGDVVRYTPKWCEPGEEKCLMVVVESYPDVKRCKVKHLNSGLFIAPVEVVDYEMIKIV